MVVNNVKCSLFTVYMHCAYSQPNIRWKMVNFNEFDLVVPKTKIWKTICHWNECCAYRSLSSIYNFNDGNPEQKRKKATVCCVAVFSALLLLFRVFVEYVVAAVHILLLKLRDRGIARCVIRWRRHSVKQSKAQWKDLQKLF